MTSRTVITIGVVSCASNRSALLRRVFDTAELIDLDVLIVHLSPFSFFFFFFSSRRRHTRSLCDWSSDVCSSDLLSAARRLGLVARARAEGWWVLEDDYDGELRYDVAPLPLLGALGPDVAVHLGTSSKIVSPTLGVGWLVAPPDLRAALVARRTATGTRPARAGQRVFAALAGSGDLARHLRRLRRELVVDRKKHTSELQTR